MPGTFILKLDIYKYVFETIFCLLKIQAAYFETYCDE
jgi:hypothetical protein